MLWVLTRSAPVMSYYNMWFYPEKKKCQYFSVEKKSALSGPMVIDVCDI